MMVRNDGSSNSDVEALVNSLGTIEGLRDQLVLWLDDQQTAFWDEPATIAWEILDTDVLSLVCVHINPSPYRSFGSQITSNAKRRFREQVAASSDASLTQLVNQEAEDFAARVGDLVRYLHVWADLDSVASFLIEACKSFSVQSIVYDVQFAVRDKPERTANSRNYQNGIDLINAVHQSVSADQWVLSSQLGIELVRKDIPLETLIDKSNSRAVTRQWGKIVAQVPAQQPLSLADQLLAVKALTESQFTFKEPYEYKNTFKHAAIDMPGFLSAKKIPASCCICRLFLRRGARRLGEVAECLPECSSIIYCPECDDDRKIERCKSFLGNLCLAFNPDWALLDGFLTCVQEQCGADALSPAVESVLTCEMSPDGRQFAVSLSSAINDSITVSLADGGSKKVTLDESITSSRSNVFAVVKGHVFIVHNSHLQQLGRIIARNFLDAGTNPKHNVAVRFSRKVTDDGCLGIILDFEMSNQPDTEQVVRDAVSATTVSDDRLSYLSRLADYYGAKYVLDHRAWDKPVTNIDFLQRDSDLPKMTFRLRLVIPGTKADAESAFWKRPT